MINKILPFLILLNITFVFCQKIELKNTIDSSQVFKGEISGIPITMQLDFDGIIDCHQYQHFIKGWYYYDKYKKKIPLTGVYDLANLYLYNFGNQQNKGAIFLRENITNLQLVEKADSIAKVLKPNEIIILKSDYSNKKNVSGNFYIENKIYPAQLFTKDSRIFRFNNYITLPNNKVINTYNFINPSGGNELISYVSDKSGNRVLLYFEEVSNFNFCGMCGASDGEKGYRVLNFTKNWAFKNYDDFLIESCRENIYSTQITKNKDSEVLKFDVDKTMNAPAYILTVDVKNATVLKSNNYLEILPALVKSS